MKRFICGFLAGALVFGTVGAFAVSYIANPAGFKVLVNGKEFVSDPPALVVEGRTYLPLRAMGDALGVPVNWNEELQQAEVGETVTANPNTDVNSPTQVQSSGKLKMTLLNVQTCKSVNEYEVARDGKEFVILTFEIENITSEQQTFNFFYLSSYIDDYKTPMTVLSQRIDGASMLGANEIAPGKKIKGYLAYEADLNWKKIDVSYKDLLTDEKDAMKFTVNK